MPLPDDILEPISADNPVGADLRYEPIYDEIREAREEEADLPQGDWKRERNTADFAKVIKLATEVLQKRSKDLQVAAWLTEAKMRREGFGGLREGIDLMRELMDRYWEGLYPPIEDGDVDFRATPLRWVGSYLGPAVKRVALNQAGHDWLDYEQSRAVGSEKDVEGDSARAAKRQEAIADGKLTAEEFDDAFDATPKAWYKALMADLKTSGESLEALDEQTQELFSELPPGDQPGYREVREALEEVERVGQRLLEIKLEREPDPPEMSAGAEGEAPAEVGAGDVAPAAGGASASDSAPAARGTVSLEPGSREDAAQRVAAAARFLRRDDPTDPAPYLMLRGFRWGELRKGGEDVDPRLLEAPPTQSRTRLKSLLLDGNWSGLLDAAEEVMATPWGRGWLDLQRYVLTALDGLGAEYEAVKKAVSGAVSSLLADLPRLPEVTLMDDSPTANRETQVWLRDEGIFNRFSEEAEEELASGGPPRGARPARDVRERAQAKVRAGQPQKAIELLLDAADQERSERQRFLRRSEATRIMVEAGLEGVAMPILKEMLQKIQAHQLEDWEAGETIAQPLGLLYKCMDRLEGESAEKQELYLRVCRLDPMQAIHFSAGSAPAEGNPQGAEAGGVQES